MKRLFLSLLSMCALPFLFAQNEPLFQSDAFSVYPKCVIQGAYRADMVSDNEIQSTFEQRRWQQQKELGVYPRFSCNIPICNTLYNLSVEELDNLIEADTTWRTGKWWGGVWTRDVNYSTLLACSYMNPMVTKTSLLKKVWKGRIIEDTGTGGSWPVSTDRIVWTLGAWQLYLVTGDKDWLHSSYEIVRNTLQQDELTVYDPVTGLVKGESSFLDWREETYPRWMQPADIAESECLGTNALFYQANVIAARMAQLCGDADNAAHFQQNANKIKTAINQHLWLEKEGYYGQYLYGRTHKIISTRSEALGEALCIIFGIADSVQARRIVSSVSLTPFGTPCIHPQIPNIYPYHNNAVWPFVQAYWMWASAIAGNSAAVEHSIAAIYRAAAIFATNQENFVAETGDYHTAMNSPNMLWSIAGNLSIAHRIFTGITFEENGLSFRPFVPECWGGQKKLENFTYRKAKLQITVEGFGDAVGEFYLDGKRQSRASVPATLKGKHTVRIVLNGQFSHSDAVNRTPVVTSAETPLLFLDASTRLMWRQVPDAQQYIILRDGKVLDTVPEKIINSNHYTIDNRGKYTEYQVIAIGNNGASGFASEPVPYYDLADEQHLAMTRFAPATTFAECKGFSGNGAVEITTTDNTRVVVTVNAPAEGDYLLSFRYANGSQTTRDSNRGANRTLWQNGQRVGTFVFPQRGDGLWDLWGYSNTLRVHLQKGDNALELRYGPENENMSQEGVNRAMLDYLKVIRL